MQLVTNLGIGGKVTVGSGAGTERSVHSFFDSEGWKSGRRKLWEPFAMQVWHAPPPHWRGCAGRSVFWEWIARGGLASHRWKAAAQVPAMRTVRWSSLGNWARQASLVICGHGRARHLSQHMCLLWRLLSNLGWIVSRWTCWPCPPFHLSHPTVKAGPTWTPNLSLPQGPCFLYSEFGTIGFGQVPFTSNYHMIPLGI